METVTRQCLGCGRQFSRTLPAPGPTRDKGFYCSLFCYRANRPKGENHYRYSGEKHYDVHGYVRINTPTGRRLEHIVMAEKALGRPLKKGEVVHHLNGNKSDNRNGNFLICTSSYHKWLHLEMGRRYQREHFNEHPTISIEKSDA